MAIENYCNPISYSPGAGTGELGGIIADKI